MNAERRTKPLIIAHCGASTLAPESTRAAFEAAIALGADALECDVHRTKDGQLVVHHDYYLGRTVAGQGYIGDWTLSDLQKLDAGSWFGSTFAHEYVPTLQEVLLLGKHRVRFEIDVRDPSKACLQQLIELLAQHHLLEHAEIISEHVPLISYTRQHYPSICTGLFFAAPPPWKGISLQQQHILDWMALARAHVAHLAPALLDATFVQNLHAQGYLVHAANLNTIQEIEQGIACGVDQFSTDDVAGAVQVRQRLAHCSP